MAHPAILAVLISAAVFGSAPYELITPILDNRAKVMTDVLDWSTLRYNGKLVSSSETLSKAASEKLETFHMWLRERYTRDIIFRAFIIAVQRGVVPKLTLKEGATCNETLVTWYKNPHNNMIDWNGISRFAFVGYHYENDTAFQFCDFSQGLSCHPTTKTCGCRPGAEMSPIKAGSSVTRCLLKKDEICALHDLEKGTYDNKFITEMIWNPERPEGCQDGLQCRYISDQEDRPKCRDPKTHTWHFPAQEKYLGIGAECSIGAAMGIHGQCDRNYGADFPGGDGVALVCFNFETSFSRKGYCAHPLGPYQVRLFWPGFPHKFWDLAATNFILGWVTRLTVPMFSLADYQEYFKTYLTKVYPKIFPVHLKDDDWEVNMMVMKEDDLYDECSVQSTQKMRQIWEFFEKLSPSYTRQQLLDEMEKMVALVKDEDHRFCRVYWTSLFVGFVPDELEPLECVSTSGGDEGRCKVKKNDDTGRALSKKVLEVAEYAGDNDPDSYDHSRKQIYENAPAKDPVCTEFQIGSPCLSDQYLCFKDYRDPEDGSVYYESTCSLKNRHPDPIPPPLCRLVTVGHGPGCERRQLEKMLTRLLESGGTKGRGDPCEPDLEQDVRKIMGGDFSGRANDNNRYNEYARLKRLGVNITYCDRTRFFTCDKSSKKCVCYPGTRPRSVKIGGLVTESDYCYAESGPCNDLTRLLDLEPLHKKEKEAIENQYGKPEQNCGGGNFCLFVDKETKECTGKDTGYTGYPPAPDTGGNTDGGTGGGSLGGSSQNNVKGGAGTMDRNVAAKLPSVTIVLGNIIIMKYLL